MKFFATMILFCSFLSLGGCTSYGRIGGWSWSEQAVPIQNNIEGTTLKYITVGTTPVGNKSGSGKDATFNWVELKTGEQMRVDPGYFGQFGTYVQLKADVYNTSTGKFLGVTREGRNIWRNNYGTYSIGQQVDAWVVSSYEPVSSQTVSPPANNDW